MPGRFQIENSSCPWTNGAHLELMWRSLDLVEPCIVGKRVFPTFLLKKSHEAPKADVIHNHKGCISLRQTYVVAPGYFLRGMLAV